MIVHSGLRSGLLVVVKVTLFRRKRIHKIFGQDKISNQNKIFLCGNFRVIITCAAAQNKIFLCGNFRVIITCAAAAPFGYETDGNFTRHLYEEIGNGKYGAERTAKYRAEVLEFQVEAVKNRSSGSGCNTVPSGIILIVILGGLLFGHRDIIHPLRL